MDHGQAKCAFTIHNMNYGADLIGRVRGVGPERMGWAMGGPAGGDDKPGMGWLGGASRRR